MNSPEDSSSFSTQKNSNWTNHQTSTPQPGLSPASPVQTPVSTNPASLSQSLISPQKQRTAENGTSDASQPHSERRKRGRPPKDKTPHTVPEHQIQSPSDSDPCSQREEETNAVRVIHPLSSNSPVPEDRCQSPDALTEVETQPLSPSPPVGTSELPSPTKDLQRVHRNEGSRLCSPSVEQGDTTSHNVLIARDHTYSLTRELEAEPFVSPQKQRTTEKGTSDQSQPHGERRKRGRPPKDKTPHTVPEHQIQSPSDSDPSSQPHGEWHRRGRPPKDKTPHTVPGHQIQSPSDSDPSSQPHGEWHKRGRPPKDKTPHTVPGHQIQSPSDSDPSSQPHGEWHKRGRPPKDKTPHTVPGHQIQSPSDSDPSSQPHGEWHKRGRPPKDKTPHTVPGHQIQSPSDSDPSSQREEQTDAVTVTHEWPHPKTRHLILSQDIRSSPLHSPVPEDRCQSPTR
ncbi:uncharacterized protein [Oncorhynchus clarkii lewisi]|uniref:uncharacterized protein n=1 Tax=Oncorhynchus clarkii lewisi TaxID=490388 RepID=UPI0039B937FC